MKININFTLISSFFYLLSSSISQIIHDFRLSYLNLQPKTRLSIQCLFLLSLIIQSIYLLALPISFEGDASIYYRYAKWIGGLETHPHVFWSRPPGYPLYLHLLGVTWAHSFNGVIALNALMGILMPILLFGSLMPLGHKWAFSSALIYAISAWPFSYAKLFITEQPYSFFMVLLAFSISRFLVTQKNGYIKLGLIAVFIGMTMRNEAVYMAIFSSLFILFFAVHKKNRANIKCVLTVGLTLLAITTTYSFCRAHALGQAELFGSLHNYSGWQLFNRVYISPIGEEALIYDFSRPKSEETSRWSSNKSRVIFVEAKNGPASKEIGDLNPGLLENPTEENFGLIVMKIMKQKDNGVNSHEYKKGILETDILLRQVVRETIAAHPEIIPLIALNAGGYLGLNFTGSNTNFFAPFFSSWTRDTYEAMPFDIGQQASASMRPILFEKYSTSQWERPEFLKLFHRAGQYLHSLLRNSLGVLLLLTIWFLPSSRLHWLSLFIFSLTALLIGSAAAGFGTNQRYEHMIIPYLIILTTLSLNAFWISVESLFKKLFK